MTAIIIDDEAGSRNNLFFLLENFCPEVKVLGWAENAESGLALISKKQPEVIFLDIEMPEQDGFQMLEQLPENIQPKIIFTTAYEQYAIKAFKVAATDYLLKPIDIEDLKSTLQRIKSLIPHHSSSITHHSSSITHPPSSITHPPSSIPKKLVIPHQSGITFLDEADIIYLEAKRNYTEIYIKNDKKLLVAKTLGDFENLLSESSFFRAHRSFIINLQYLEQWVNKDGGYLLMTNDQQVPLARNRREGLFRLIEGF